MGKTAFDSASRGNVYNFDPDDLVLIEDPKHPLFDPRVLKTPKPRMIASIIANGVLQPINVIKDGDRALVSAGRQRVKAAREANKQLRAKGLEPVTVPAVYKKGMNEEQGAETAAIENAIREDETLLEKAAKALRLSATRPIAKVAEIFGVSEVTINNWLGLLEMSPAVQNAVEEERVTMTDALKLGKLPKSEQVEAVKKLEESKPTQKARKAAGKVAKRRASPRKLAAFLDTEDGKNALSDKALVVLLWCMGEASNKDLTDEFPKLEPFFKG